MKSSTKYLIFSVFFKQNGETEKCKMHSFSDNIAVSYCKKKNLLGYQMYRASMILHDGEWLENGEPIDKQPVTYYGEVLSMAELEATSLEGKTSHLKKSDKVIRPYNAKYLSDVVAFDENIKVIGSSDNVKLKRKKRGKIVPC